MNTFRTSVWIALAALWLTPGAATAQEQMPLRVAMCVPGKIFRQLHETQELQRRMDAERERFEREERERRERLEGLRMHRDQLMPGMPQFDERHQELVRAMIEFEAWGRVMQMEVQRKQKQHTKHLFDRIQQGAGEVARQRGFHMVIAEPEVPENIDMVTPEQLNMALTQRNVLYAADLVDISDDIVAHLNERFREGR
jgi:Skp family chaperone for outer membrane proteins